MAGYSMSMDRCGEQWVSVVAFFVIRRLRKLANRKKANLLILFVIGGFVFDGIGCRWLVFFQSALPKKLVKSDIVAERDCWLLDNGI